MDGSSRLRGAAALHRHRAFLSLPYQRCQLQLWLGDRPHRLLAGQWAWIQFALRRRYRAVSVERAGLSLDRVARLPDFRSLFACCGIRPSDIQQHLRRAYLLAYLPYRATHLQPARRPLVRLGVGAAALHHLLVGTLDMGDQSLGVSPEPGFHADGRDGRRRSPLIVVRLWTVVGHHRPHQSLGAVVSSLRRGLAGLSTLSAR